MKKLLLLVTIVFGMSCISWIPAHAIETKYPKATYYQTFIAKKNPLLIPARTPNQGVRVIKVDPKKEDKKAYEKKD